MKNIFISNNYQKKKISLERSFKIDLNQVFPCFHWSKSIPPTHIYTITPKFKKSNDYWASILTVTSEKNKKYSNIAYEYF